MADRKRVPVSRNSNAASRSKPSSPVKKLSPAAAARVRAKMSANARMRKTLMTPGDVTKTGVAPAGSAAAAAFKLFTGAAKSKANRSMLKTMTNQQRTARRNAADGMTTAERRMAALDPAKVRRELANLELRASEGMRRTPKYSGVTDRDNIAATNRMIPRKPKYRRRGQPALNSPTRRGYQPPTSVARPPAMKAKAKPPAKPGTTGIESMRFTGKTDRQGYKYGADRPENTAKMDADLRRERAAGGAPSGNRVTRMATSARRITPKQAERERLERNRKAQEAAGRYGKGPSDAEKMAARDERRAQQRPEERAPRLTKAQIERNREAADYERIKPVPMKPKASDSPEKAAKINAEIRRVEAQNDRAREASASKRAAVEQPRPSTTGYVAGRSAKQRLDDVAAKRQAADNRPKRDPEAFRKLDEAAKRDKEARDAKAVADRAAARASNPANIARQKEKAAKDKADAQARADRAARDTEILNKNRPRKKIVRKKR